MSETARIGRKNRHLRQLLVGMALPWIGVMVAPHAAGIDSRPIRIGHCVEGDRLGASVSAAGDVDGDGLEDVVYGAPGMDAPGANSGGATVLIGPRRDDGSSDESRTVQVVGGQPGDRLGRTVAAAGDVNRDGYDDVIIGAPGLDAESRVDAGGAFVLLGSAAPQEWDLRDENVAAFTVFGEGSGDRVGESVAAAGDVNGDGFDDVILGGPGVDVLGREDAGAAYVVFGGGQPRSVDLAVDGTDRTMIYGGHAFDRAGISVTGLGDVNLDGLDDLAIGAYGYDGEDGGFTGAVFVLWGSSVPANADLALVGHLSDIGFAITGARAGDDAGWSIASAGDVNADGVPDIALGARGVDSRRYLNVGAAYVVFGQHEEAQIDLNELGKFGYRILGSRPFDLTGSSLTSFGDVTGDGLPELALAAPLASREAHRAGVVYVVPGKSVPGGLRLPRAGVLQIEGRTRMAELGTSLAGNVDVNADSYSDILIGAPGERHLGARRCGGLQLILGPLIPTSSS